MRLHYTAAFEETRAELRAAIEHYRTFDDEGEGAEEREEAAGKRLHAADEAFFGADIYTASEVLAKFNLGVERAYNSFELTAFYSEDAIRLDLERLRRLEPSPAIYTMFMNFRRAAEAEQDAGAVDSAHEKRSKAYLTLVRAACTTPGDFILKQYLRLLEVNGGCLAGRWKEDLTANPWDVDISDDVDEGCHDTADKHATYADIDGTDIGANLLAYGLPHFDAEAWMEAADRIGLHVDVIVAADGKRTFGWCEPLGDEALTERIKRERDRLIRIMNFEPGRIRDIADEIERDWPQLIRNTSTRNASDLVIKMFPAFLSYYEPLSGENPLSPNVENDSAAARIVEDIRLIVPRVSSLIDMHEASRK